MSINWNQNLRQCRVSAWLLLALVLGACQSVKPQSVEAKNTVTADQHLDQQIRELLNSVDADDPGLELLVRHQDEVVVQYARGLANRTTQLAIDEHTGFRLGSIAKPFTAIAIMQLVEQGRLQLDDAVTHYLPILGEEWQHISIGQLLSHRVKLSQDFFDRAHLSMANGADNLDLIEFLVANRVRATPTSNSQARYCNTCYVLLAQVVAEASGEPFASYMQQHLFNAAAMADSYLVEKGDSLHARAALNYAKSQRFFGIVQYTTGAMAQVSSVSDLNHFLIALKRGDLITPVTLQLMTQQQADLGDDGLYGLGWEIGYGDQPFYAHGGSQDGYQTQLLIYPKYQLEIVVLSNSGDSGFELSQQLLRTVITHYKNRDIAKLGAF